MKFINFLIKPASSLCNLRCKYCFYADEALNREQQSMGLMSEEAAETLIREAYACIEPGGTVGFAFQGGEPTVAGFPFFEFFTRTARELCPKDVSISFSIQTNATLLDEAWAEFSVGRGSWWASPWTGPRTSTTSTVWTRSRAGPGERSQKPWPCCRSIRSR